MRHLPHTAGLGALGSRAGVQDTTLPKKDEVWSTLLRVPAQEVRRRTVRIKAITIV